MKFLVGSRGSALVGAIALFSFGLSFEKVFATETPPTVIPIVENDESKTPNSPILNSEDREKIQATQETHQYQAEVTRLMDIIINSLYTQKEVFLRELISNSVDALEKVRFTAISDKSVLDLNPNLDIKIEYDSAGKTLTITDSGIGMSKNELINNLGTVAKSGTSNFLEALAQGNDVNLIGQFGVGFYSAFLVADRVTVVSKCKDDDQYIWESSADAKYYVAKDPRGNTMSRGTSIVLHLKEDSTELLNEYRLKELVSRYSQFMSYPIYLKVEKTETEEVADEPESESDAEKKTDDVQVTDEEEKPKKTKTIEKKRLEWEQVNVQKAVWLRPKEEVKDSEYKELYKAISKDYSDPLTWIHFTAEGEIEFKALLFIPRRQPSDIFNSYFGKQTSLKLYVRRVLVADSFDELLPKYLSFMRGVVDSDDLPLNVSREQLQQHKILGIMSKKLVRKTLETIRKMYLDGVREKEEMQKKLDSGEVTDEEERKTLQKKIDSPSEFSKFYTEFSRNLMLGCYEDDANRDKIAKVLQFPTSRNPEKMMTLEEYVNEMPASQNSIYYAAGDSKEQILKLPQMQIFRKKNIPVFFLTDSMDEPCLQRLVNFEGKKFESIQKGDVSLEETDDEKKTYRQLRKHFEPLTKWWKGQLGNKIMKVEISKRLVDAPCAIVASQWGYSAQMEKIMKTQTFADPMHMKMMAGQKVFEINPHHKVIQHFLEKAKEGNFSPDDTKQAEFLFEAALLASGFDVDNPSDLASVLYTGISKELGITDIESPLNMEIEFSSDNTGEHVKDEASASSMPGLDGMNPSINMDEILKNMNINADKDEL